MTPLNLDDVRDYIQENIGQFHERRITRLEKIVLEDILKRKNPYLFKAKNVLTAEQIVRGVVDAHISSNEETFFGTWLEKLAIFVNGKVYGGRKSGIKGIDLEFDKDGRRYIVSIKSGPNWGNAGQIAKMRDNFRTAQKTLRTSDSKLQIVAINGCCYGKDNQDRGDYHKLCGQKFWEFISNEKSLFIEIIEPLSHRAKERNEEFLELYSQKINLFTLEFGKRFCGPSGEIDWKKWLRFNSGAS